MYCFNRDNNLVIRAYNDLPNYKIEYDKTSKDKSYCAIYFSSHGIYFPDKEEVVQRKLFNLNSFEFYKTRIHKAYKHIFLRDVYKQWYLKGINEVINTPERLLEFLKEQTKGFKIICIGSSGGGTQLHSMGHC